MLSNPKSFRLMQILYEALFCAEEECEAKILNITINDHKAIVDVVVDSEEFQITIISVNK